MAETWDISKFKEYLKKNNGKLRKPSGDKYKEHIEDVLIALKINYESEYRFDKERKFRFDFALPENKIAIEYNGIMSEKSRHTSITGYSKDMSKLNLAAINGWRVLQYTPLNIKEFDSDIHKLIQQLQLCSL